MRLQLRRGHYKCQLHESPLEVSQQPTRGDPYERSARSHADLPIHPLPHFQQGRAQLRSLSSVPVIICNSFVLGISRQINLGFGDVEIGLQSVYCELVSMQQQQHIAET